LVYDTHNDYLPAFHQVLVSIQILFLRSDVLVVPTSFLTGIAVSIAVFAFARSLGWRGHLPLGAALVLWTMPAFLLHVSTTNFDILTGLWLVLTLYFLRRGYAAADLRWIAAAALATGLGLATKLTFVFAVPALAVVWFATFARALLRGRRLRAAQLVAAAVIAVSTIGLPFLLRNVVVQGYLLGPPQLEAYISGNLSPAERLRALAFNLLALGFELVTPPFLLPPEKAERLNASFVSRASALGFTLPDPKLTSAVDLQSIIRHALPEHRYDSNHASFGAAFVLVILPSMLAVGFARRPLGARWLFAMACLVTWVAYVGTYGLAYIYQTSSMRFLIEPMIVVAAISPAWLALLPRRIAATLLVVLAIPLVAEVKDVIANSRWAPPTQVLQTPRVDQISVFAGAPPNDAARELDRKYPPRLVPEIYVDDAGTGHPYFPDYTFLGPTLQRRARYWVGRSGVVPPGPLLTNDPNVATILLNAGMLPDRLSADVWLLLPNDRLRVRVAIVRPMPGDGPILRMVASVPPEHYRVPQFALFQVSKESMTTLRQYAEEPTFDLPLTFENRQRALRIAVRDASFPQQAETVELDRAYLLGL
jgi:hypothetical protein